METTTKASNKTSFQRFSHFFRTNLIRIGGGARAEGAGLGHHREAQNITSYRKHRLPTGSRLTGTSCLRVCAWAASSLGGHLWRRVRNTLKIYKTSKFPHCPVSRFIGFKLPPGGVATPLWAGPVPANTAG